MTIATTLTVALIALKKWLKRTLHKSTEPPNTQPSTENTVTSTQDPNSSQIPL